MSRPAAVELPSVATVVELPRSDELLAAAGAFATRWVMRLTMLVLAALALLCLIGPHIPAGE